MTRKLKISVITPSYNQARYLESAITSVLDQQYPNLEYIIIDGGSADESVNIIKRYESRIFYSESRPDKGQAEALNKGLRKASGDILCWLNSDDMYAPNAFDRVVEVFEADTDAGVVIGNAWFVGSSGEALKIYRAEDRPLHELIQFWRGWPIPQPAVFFRSEVLRQAGFVDESLRYVMDMELFLRMKKVARFRFLDEVLAYYRLHAESKTGNWKTQRYLFWKEGRQVTESYWGPRWSVRYWSNRFSSALALRQAKQDYLRRQ